MLPSHILHVLATLPERLGRPATRGGYIAQLDGLRFAAIALVLVWHISLRAARYADQLKASGQPIKSLYLWFPHGEIGVALFFFVSGFVIAQPFLGRARGSWNFAQFYTRRLQRIYPPYLIALLACFAIVAATGFAKRDYVASTSGSLVASIFYLNGLIFDEPSRFNPPIWSLEVEIQFYLIAPFLLLGYTMLGSLRTRVTVAVLAVAALVLASSWLEAVYPFDARFRFGLFAHAYLFIAGIAAADLARAQNPLVKVATRAHDLLFALGLVLLVLVGWYLTRIDAKLGGGWAAVLAYAGILASVLATYAGAMRGRLARDLMGNPWLCLMGTMCFSIYLVHVVVIEGVYKKFLAHLPLNGTASIWLVYFLVLIPLSLLVSLTFYVLVERPFMMRNPLQALRQGVWWNWLGQPDAYPEPIRSESRIAAQTR